MSAHLCCGKLELTPACAFGGWAGGVTSDYALEEPAPRAFEQLSCLGKATIGPGIEIYGSGSDGGRSDYLTDRSTGQQVAALGGTATRLSSQTTRALGVSRGKP